MEPTPRKRLEIIVDSCSMGDKKIRGITGLLDRVMQRDPKVFEDYRIVIPLQLGTELRQRMFADFLQEELDLSRKERGLNRFCREHRCNLEIVETESSQAFKMFYAKKALAVLRDKPALRGHVMQEARRLAARYEPDSDIAINSSALKRFLNSIEKIAVEQEEKLQTAKDGLLGYYESKEADKPRVSELKALERKNLARASVKFFGPASIQRRYLMQALYSTRQVYDAVSQDQEFRNFRTDLGERAIEDYLYSKRSETDPRNVSLVVSEDRGARNSIQKLRGHTNNTVFVIGSYGLALALKQIGLVDSLYDIMEPELMAQVKTSRTMTSKRRNNGAYIGMNDINEPDIERKWARRLVEVMDSGQWTQHHKRERAKPASGMGL